MAQPDAAASRRRVIGAFVGLLLLVLLAALWIWLVPAQPDREPAVRLACADADRLIEAGLLDDARAAYRRIEKYAGDELKEYGLDSCARGEIEIMGLAAWAAYQREQGDQYLAAVRLTRTNKGAKATRKFAQAQRRAVTLAEHGYVRALKIDPFVAAAHASLGEVLTMRGVPPDLAANRRCEIARRLVEAKLFSEAALVYGQALRTGRTSTCVTNRLREARRARQYAAHLYDRGRRFAANEDAVGRCSVAALDGNEIVSDPDTRDRVCYLVALRTDPALAVAKTALAGTTAPDPREGTIRGQWAVLWDAGGDATSWAVDAADWVEEHLGAIVIALVAVIVLLFLFRALVLALTRSGPGRSFVRSRRTPRFAVTSPRVMPFTPEDAGATTTTVFLHWLSAPLVKPDAGQETVADSPDPLDVWQPAGEELDVAALLGGGAGAIAALIAYVRTGMPRRELRFSGNALARGKHGPGLRVLLLSRRGRPRKARFWWATDLPGAPLSAEDQEADARHALAIRAATWAQYEVLK